jgi:Na+-driven multidrug efflux pump
MLRDHWPRTAWYALMPPLAVVLLLRVAQAQETSRVVVILSVFGALLNLLFKGATVAFYLRNVEVGDTGAAFLERPGRVAPD